MSGVTATPTRIIAPSQAAAGRAQLRDCLTNSPASGRDSCIYSAAMEAGWKQAGIWVPTTIFGSSARGRAHFKYLPKVQKTHTKLI
jgi:hypothetical protein